LEAHVNAIAEEFALLKDLPAHDRSVLLEEEVRLENGEFALGSFRMIRLEDRILFLHGKFSGSPLDKSTEFWGLLKTA
jgi:hypothetical protein